MTGFYTRSLHREHEGEWDFDLTGSRSSPSRCGPAGCTPSARATPSSTAGCGPLPVLVLSSGASPAREMGEDVHDNDVVLDVAQIRQWAPAIGPHVTYVAIAGARHDVVLSREEPRAQAYAAVSSWMTRWLDPPYDRSCRCTVCWRTVARRSPWWPSAGNSGPGTGGSEPLPDRSLDAARGGGEQATC